MEKNFLFVCQLSLDTSLLRSLCSYGLVVFIADESETAHCIVADMEFRV